jgi:hypothetical protein
VVVVTAMNLLVVLLLAAAPASARLEAVSLAAVDSRLAVRVTLSGQPGMVAVHREGDAARVSMTNTTLGTRFAGGTHFAWMPAPDFDLETLSGPTRLDRLEVMVMDSEVSVLLHVPPEVSIELRRDRRGLLLVFREDSSATGPPTMAQTPAPAPVAPPPVAAPPAEAPVPPPAPPERTEPATAMAAATPAAEAPAATPEPPVGLAVRVTAPPALDGSVLDDPAWTDAPVLTGFRQTAPDEGQPASERTEVRVVFDDEAIYIGAVCFDRTPDRIIVSESRRDSPLENTDSFQVILDTYYDRRSGFVFGTNPTSLEYDGQVDNEGQGSRRGRRRQSGGTGAGFNLNWDADWQVRTRIGDFGWSAEFAIPFRTLRYAGGGVQTWGINFQRNIRRRNETAFWAPLERQYTLYRLRSAGTLQGLEAPSQRNLKIAPYVLGESQRDFTTAEGTRQDVDIGGDLKYSLTPSLTLDLTVNTDFAQVEVDEIQINLDRFNLFFPEKRPFFLENAGLFSAGESGEVELFFSRRIGLGPDGEIVPILAGARLSGKVGSTGIGVLNMQTRAVEGLTPANNFTVARVSHELPNRSSLGGIFVNRAATGEMVGEAGQWNRTYGIDGRLGIGQYGEISGFAAGTDTPGIEADDYAYRVGTGYSSPAWRLSGEYTEVGEGFNPEVGFLARTAYRKPSGLISYAYRPRDFLGLQEVRPHIFYRGYWKPDGFQESGRLHISSNVEWKNSWNVHASVNLTHEGVIEAFEIVDGVWVPPGVFKHAQADIRFQTDLSAPLGYSADLEAGGFFGGDIFSLTQSLKWRIGGSFITDSQWEYNDAHLPGGDFTANRVRVRLSYTFTPRIYLQALLQYSDVDVDFWSANVRFGWLHRGGTGLFLVYNEVRESDGVVSGFGPRDRTFTIKFSRVFDLLR